MIRLKIAEEGNPVRLSWLTEQGARLDARPYVSASYAARAFLQGVPKTDALEDIALRIFHPGRVKRQWTTDPRHGVKFMGSADVFESDLSWLPIISADAVALNNRLLLESGWTLITRSGMTAGRVTRARLDMAGLACSEDVMRVVPDPRRIRPGYLYAFLSSRFGIAVIKGGIYGTSVRHIEPHHVRDLPVPRLDDSVEERIDERMEESAILRQKFQCLIVDATRDLFESAGLAHLLDLRWHERPKDLDFEVQGISPMSLRAINYAPRAQQVLDAISSVEHRSLGEICAGGTLKTGARFKRVDAAPDLGVRLIGQRQAFWIRPEGRWINPSVAPADIQQEDETVLIAAHGTLGETEVFARSIFVTGRWLEHAFSQDFVRVLSGQVDFPGAYLYAFLRSEAAFRLLRSMSVGGKQQEFHPALLHRLPVPECNPKDRQRVAATVRTAFKHRDEADRNEDEAMALLEEAVREAAQ